MRTAIKKTISAIHGGAHAVAALLPTEGGSPTVAAGSMARASATDDSFAEVAARDGATVLVTVPSAAVHSTQERKHSY